ncbi:PEP-CTERM sorting domain-containing protein [Phycisphaeraceae bacterium D3-23]
MKPMPLFAAMATASLFASTAAADSIVETFDGGTINTHNGTTVVWADGGGTLPWAPGVSGLLPGDHYESGQDLDHGQTSTLNLTVMIGPSGGTLEFDYGLGSEPGFDFFRLFLDGPQIFADSGTTTSSFGPFALTPGTHVISFQYEKDQSVSSGADAVAIDNVVVTGLAPEPTSLAMLGLGGLAVMRRRRAN